MAPTTRSATKATTYTAPVTRSKSKGQSYRLILPRLHEVGTLTLLPLSAAGASAISKANSECIPFTLTLTQGWRINSDIFTSERRSSCSACGSTASPSTSPPEPSNRSCASYYASTSSTSRSPWRWPLHISRSRLQAPDWQSRCVHRTIAESESDFDGGEYSLEKILQGSAEECE